VSLDALREILCCISVETTKFKIIVHLVQCLHQAAWVRDAVHAKKAPSAPSRTFPSRMGLGSTYHSAYETEGEFLEYREAQNAPSAVGLAVLLRRNGASNWLLRSEIIGHDWFKFRFVALSIRRGSGSQRVNFNETNFNVCCTRGRGRAKQGERPTVLLLPSKSANLQVQCVVNSADCTDWNEAVFGRSKTRSSLRTSKTR
jgi:hypothetical protein